MLDRTYRSPPCGAGCALVVLDGPACRGSITRLQLAHCRQTRSRGRQTSPEFCRRRKCRAQLRATKRLTSASCAKQHVRKLHESRLQYLALLHNLNPIANVVKRPNHTDWPFLLLVLKVGKAHQVESHNAVAFQGRPQAQESGRLSAQQRPCPTLCRIACSVQLGC